MVQTGFPSFMSANEQHAEEEDSCSIGLESSTPAQPFHGLRVMLVDDNQVNLSILSTLLKRRFAHLLACAPVAVDSGLKALQLLRTGVYDVIFLDIQMPYLNGGDCTRRIRAGKEGILPANRDVHIVAVTTVVGPKPEQVYRAAGFDGCMSKPVRFEHMFHFIGPLAQQADAARASCCVPPISITSPMLEPFEKTLEKRVDGGDQLEEHETDVIEKGRNGYVSRQRTCEVIPPLPSATPSSARRPFYVPRAAAIESRSMSSFSSSSASGTTGNLSEKDALAQQFQEHPGICVPSLLEQQLKAQTKESLKKAGAVLVTRTNKVNNTGSPISVTTAAPTSAAAYTRIDQIVARVGSCSSDASGISITSGGDGSNNSNSMSSTPGMTSSLALINANVLEKHQEFHTQSLPQQQQDVSGESDDASSSCDDTSVRSAMSAGVEDSKVDDDQHGCVHSFLEGSTLGGNSTPRGSNDPSSSGSTPLVMHLAVDKSIVDVQISPTFELNQHENLIEAAMPAAAQFPFDEPALTTADAIRAVDVAPLIVHPTAQHVPVDLDTEFRSDQPAAGQFLQAVIAHRLSSPAVLQGFELDKSAGDSSTVEPQRPLTLQEDSCTTESAPDIRTSSIEGVGNDEPKEGAGDASVQGLFAHRRFTVPLIHKAPVRPSLHPLAPPGILSVSTATSLRQ